MITTANVPNLPGWLDLGSPNPGDAAEFYRATFGWIPEVAAAPDGEEPPGGPYRLLRKGGQVVAGLGGLDDPNAKSDWTMYVRVADAEATIKTSESLGGTVRVPFMEIGAEGGFAQLTDPSGGEFALWQPGTTVGVERCCEDDSVLWFELWTRDPEAAKRYYGELFGWKTDPFAMGDDSYDMWTTTPGVDLDAFGGIVPIVPDLPIQDEKWIPYFMVADTDATVAKAEAAGGTVIAPPEDAPPGRLAALADPFGARFSLLQPTPR